MLRMRWVPQRDIKRCIWMNKWMQHMIHTIHGCCRRRFLLRLFNFISDTFLYSQTRTSISWCMLLWYLNPAILLVNWCDDLPRIRHLIHIHTPMNALWCNSFFTLLLFFFNPFTLSLRIILRFCDLWGIFFCNMCMYICMLLTL